MKKDDLEYFFSYAMHEVRQPLYGIKSLLKGTLKEEKLPEEEINLCIERIDSLTEFLTHFLEQVQSGSYKPDLHIRAFSVEELVRRMQGELGPLAREQGVGLSIAYDKLPYHYLYTDGELLFQICSNLITNAVKYTEPGGRVSVSIWGKEVEEYRMCLNLVVKDTGRGMSEEFQEQAFDPFAREETGKQPGTELGLYITKNLVESFHGEIRLESRLGEGTRVIVSMEADAADEYFQKTEKKEEEILFSPAESIIKGKKILIAEDDELYMNLTVEILEKYGAVVDKTYDGREVVDLFEESGLFEYDMILMDLKMPEWDGLRAAQNIRDMDREDAGQVPIFLFSGQPLPKKEEFLRRHKLSGNIPKVFTEKEIIKELEKFWES